MRLLTLTTSTGTPFVMAPSQGGAPAPTLFLFAMGGADTLTIEPYCRVGQLLHAQGWTVVSLDLPCHGADLRAAEPVELAGWAARTAAGVDIVSTFQEQVNDVADHLIAQGAADPARIAAAGTSRGGFLAFQAAAGNPRIRAIAAFAPVTDLLALREFAGQEMNPLTRRLALLNVVDEIAKRSSWITIGNADARVGTDKAIAFARAVTIRSHAQGGARDVTLRVLPDPGHYSKPQWHDAAAAWLLQTVASPERILPAQDTPPAMPCAIVSPILGPDPEPESNLQRNGHGGSRTMMNTMLAIDDIALPLRKNVCLHISKPAVRPEPVLVPSPAGSNAPDNLATHFYGTVLHDAGRFRMWYYACHRGRNPDWPARQMQQIVKKPNWVIGLREGYEVYQGPLCYAESDDGITWIKPALGQVLFKGSRANNAIDLPHTLVSGAAVIRDETEPEPSRRYKMIYQYFPDQTAPVIPEYGTTPSMACAVSPDGLAWTVTVLPFVNQFVEHCSFIKHKGQFIVHSQVFPGSWAGTYAEGGTEGGRTGVAHSTYDFDRWPDLWTWAFTLPEPAVPADRGANKPYDQVHLGVGAASLGNVCVGVYGLWHNQAFGEDFGRITCDLGLVVSNDGIRFREPGATPGQVFISRDESKSTPAPGRDFNTILCQGNGILNVGDETRIYHGRWRNAGMRAEDIAGYYRAEVALATLPRDRWGALRLNHDANAGSIVTAPFNLSSPEGELRLNANGVAGMTIDLLDEHMRPIPGFAGGQVGGPDGLDCPVGWAGHTLLELRDRMVRVQIHMRRTGDVFPEFYALYG